MENHYIYKITNLINGKNYIGQRICPENKIPETDTKYMGSGIKIKNAEKKYGLDNFEKTILIKDIQDKNKINSLEIYYIRLFRRMGKAEYNISEGGYFGNCYKYKTEEEMKVIRTKMSKSATGRHLSQSTKDKLSKLEKGKKYSKEHNEKISKARKGMKFTDEHKKNIGLSGKGRIPWNKGKKGIIKQTEETKKKISESLKKRRLNEKNDK